MVSVGPISYSPQGHTLKVIPRKCVCVCVCNAVMGHPLISLSLLAYSPVRSLGLYIRGVEEESRSRKEGLFQEEECIVKINNTDLMDKTFSQ